MNQLTLNLHSRITTGKKTERLSVPCSEEFLSLVDKVAQLKNISRAELAYTALLKELQSSLGEIFMIELHGDKSLSELV